MLFLKSLLLVLGFAGFSSAALAAETKLYCEAEGGQRTPKLVVKGSGHTLFLCGTKEKNAKGKLELSGFRVFALGKGGKKSRVFQSEDERVHFWAAKEGEGISLQELIWDGREHIPAFTTKIECTEQGCKAGAAACALETPKNTSKKTLVLIHAYMTGDKKGKVPDEKLIHRLAGLAYSGDKEAQALFQNRGSLSLDGASSDAYFDHQAVLERLKKAGCLKL